MPESLLSIVRQHAGEQGLAQPASVAGNSDPYCVQCIGLLNAFNRDLARRKVWQRNRIEKLHTSIAAESQGDINELCPQGYVGLDPETVWDRTQKLPWIGGVNSSEWQYREASQMTGPLVVYRLRNNQLLCNPPPAAGHTIAWEYFSNWFVQQAAANAQPATAKLNWTMDTDYCRISDTLPVSYLTWAWAKKKGFDYAEDFISYELEVAALLQRDDAPRRIDMGETCRDMKPGVLVPAGSWNLP